MKRVLLVSHRPIDQVGGSTARWRAFSRYLPEHGWEVEVISAPVRSSGIEFTADPAAQRRVVARARVMAQVGRAADPVAAVLGVKPEALPPSMAWALTGAAKIRERIQSGAPDVVVATSPPMAAVIAARRALEDGGPPFVAEMRDLWAGSPAFDRRGGALTRVERWAFGRAAAIVVMSPEAAADVAARHPALAGRIREIANGFDPALMEIAAADAARPGADAACPGADAARRGADAARPGADAADPSPDAADPRPDAANPGADAAPAPITLIHSGILTPGRSPAPLLRVLERQPYRERFRLVLHGYATPDVVATVAKADPAVVELVPPSDWNDAIARIAAADAGVVLQGAVVGDATAVASKVFEYLVLGKPVLTVTDGGATEALLMRLGAGDLAARLDDGASIAAALDRLLAGPPQPLEQATLEPYDRRKLAAGMAALLDEVAG
jgi:glycosyltransferase involved in cell wall biosynthesis